MWNSNQRKHANTTTNHDSHANDTSLIASGTRIKGDVHFSGALHLDGVIEGSVSADPDNNAVFTLSEHGRVTGEVHVPHAVINGIVKGNIHAVERLELAAQACVEGDVHYRVLEMAAGAQINGRMVHQKESPRQITHQAEEGNGIFDDDVVMDGGKA
ncbi:polymer-forming cytoskeletal protein [Oleiagrimonas citrea]|jgi:cytoskeletal protein CcmA (bactofilin family)|uniref:Polymer-forming cytoskeletal protein n=1 Tax=Oleiagrimonas citrea TaxID=1665687 RepID=A0A846ZNR8_9GAMM|nr:polymer-forming cytoskeletal protein [Oleiagrimonas citrea]NKZ39834.1 polymer-forming cytoskeletal protein [Oleiagrimonas citrea]